MSADDVIIICARCRHDVIIFCCLLAITCCTYALTGRWRHYSSHTAVVTITVIIIITIIRFFDESAGLMVISVPVLNSCFGFMSLPYAYVKHIFWLCLDHDPCTIILISEVVCIIGRETEIKLTFDNFIRPFIHCVFPADAQSRANENQRETYSLTDRKYMMIRHNIEIMNYMMRTTYFVSLIGLTGHIDNIALYCVTTLMSF